MTTDALELTSEQKQLVATEVTPIVEKANALVVRTSEQSFEAQGLVKELKRRRAAIHEKFDPPVRAAHAAWKAAKDLYNLFVNPFDEAETIIKRKVVTFESELERKRQEEARLAEAKRQEQERLRREELERQARAAEAKGKLEKAEALREKAETVVAPPVFMPPEPPKAEGTGFKKEWKGECYNIMELLGAITQGKAPVTLIEINESALNAAARTYKDTQTIPGVRFFEKTIMSSRIR